MEDVRTRIENLEIRLLAFAKKIIHLSVKLKRLPMFHVISNQLIRSGTSIGANYAEANASESSKDFIHKIEIARKEVRETVYWLKLVQSYQLPEFSVVKDLMLESIHFLNIFGSMCKKVKHRIDTKQGKDSRVKNQE